MSHAAMFGTGRDRGFDEGGVVDRDRVPQPSPSSATPEIPQAPATPEAADAPSPQTLRPLAEAYLARCTGERRLDTATVKAYRCDIDQYLAWAQGQPKGEHARFTRESVRVYLIHLNAKYSPSSVKRKMAALRAWANWMAREERIERSPFKGLDMRIRKPYVLPRVIGPADLRLLMDPGQDRVPEQPPTITRDQRDLRDQVVLELLIATGARVSEVCNLDISSVDMESHVVRIFGKGSKERIVYLGSRHTIEALEGYLAVRIDKRETGDAAQEEPALFLNSARHRLGEQGVREIIRRRARETGVQAHITPHMFRHTFATLLLEQDVDIRYIQKLLGHSSIRTTERYTHASSARLKEIMKERNPRDILERGQNEMGGW